MVFLKSLCLKEIDYNSSLLPNGDLDPGFRAMNLGLLSLPMGLSAVLVILGLHANNF